MVLQAAHLEAVFAKQGAWADEQRRSMGFTNDRLEHLVVVVRSEIHQEHAREAQVGGGRVSFVLVVGLI